MKCPFCGSTESQVKDSRPAEDTNAIRRRRVCQGCGARFTTYERVQLREFMVLKSDGSREPFDRNKLERSLRVALRKRPVDEETISRVVNGIIRQLEVAGDSDVKTHEIGEITLQALHTLDKVGYIRYASVYQDFRNESDFNAFIDSLKE